MLIQNHWIQTPKFTAILSIKSIKKSIYLLVLPAILTLTSCNYSSVSSGASKVESGDKSSQTSPESSQYQQSGDDSLFMEAVSCLESACGRNTNHNTQIAKDARVHGKYGVSKEAFGNANEMQVLSRFKRELTANRIPITNANLARAWKAGIKGAINPNICYKDAGGIHDTSCSYAQVIDIYINSPDSRPVIVRMGWLNYYKKIIINGGVENNTIQPIRSTYSQPPAQGGGFLENQCTDNGGRWDTKEKLCR